MAAYKVTVLLLVVIATVLRNSEGQVCFDEPICGEIGMSICVDPLDMFGAIYCPIMCETCNTTDFVDRNASTSLVGGDDCTEQADDPNCRDVGQKICDEPLKTYSLVNCRTFCEFCGNNVTIPATTDIPAPPTKSPAPPTESAVPPTEYSAAPPTESPAPPMIITSTSLPLNKTEAPISGNLTQMPITGCEGIEDDPSCRQIGSEVCYLDFGKSSCRVFCELCGGVPPTRNPKLFEDCNTTAEVVFVLDSSSSVGESNFQIMREFTQNVSHNLKSEYEKLNITIITYSDEARVTLQLNETADIDTILAAEATIGYDHGGTQTHKALDLMINAFSDDINNPKIAIIVTDGASFEPVETQKSAMRAKSSGIVIFAIGVGDDVNQHETSAMSSDPDSRYLFQVTDFRALQSIGDQFHGRDCTVTTTTEEPITTTTQPTTTTTTEMTTTTTEATTTTQTPTTTTTTTTKAPPPTTTTNAPITTTTTKAPTTTTTTQVPTTLPPTTTTTKAPTTTTMTKAPTTQAPTTQAPTTQAPTTVAPVTEVITTTEEPKTPSPTTAAPVTLAPMTTTKAPETAAPTTEPPTPPAPSTTTKALETTAPTTEVPTAAQKTTTKVPKTVAPTTQPPTPQAPTTTTKAPETIAPTTEAPTAAPTTTTKSPETVAPTTEPPTPPAPTTTIKAPGTAAPTTETSTASLTTTTEAPVTAAPTTEAPTPAQTTTTKAPETATPTTDTQTAAPTTTTKTPETFAPTTESSTPPAPTTTTKSPETTALTTKAPTAAPSTTTIAPETAAPTTEAPTTAPTTEAPTTVPTTTAKSPETAAPTTEPPTPPAPTTTTKVPETAAPTTEAPTAAPTTTTKAPETAAPTTEPPVPPAPTTTTKAPETAAPTTETSTAAPTTTTKIPETAAPTTKAPTTPPTTTTKTPETAAPTTEPPAPPAPTTTTKVPETASPTTESSTAAPTTTTTNVPETAAPTTKALTAAPTTTIKVPETAAPTTQAPTAVPTTTTKAPETAAPTTQAPVTATPTTTTTEEIKTTPAATTTTAPITTTASCIAKFADVVFVVDASGSIGLENFAKVKQFIKQVVMTFDVDPQYTRVALVEYSSQARIEFKFNEKANMTELLDAIDNINYSGGGTTTSDAIQLMRTQGFEHERPDAPDIAIVITDGLSKYPPLTRIQADLAKKEQITMFSIGIGNDTSLTEMKAIATSERFMFEVGDYETLLTLDSVVAHRACGIVLPENHITRVTTTPRATPAGCADLSPNCDTYPRDSCTDYESYSRANCARTCGFCPGFPLVEKPCKDEIEDCDAYGTDMCYNPSQYEWVDSHCRLFCGYCGNKTDLDITTPAPVTITTTEKPCVDFAENCNEFGSDVCTNPTYKIWAKEHCPKYCGYCFNYKYVESQHVMDRKCPAWKLPMECNLEYSDDDKCCPVPKCPSGFRLAVQRE